MAYTSLPSGMAGGARPAAYDGPSRTVGRERGLYISSVNSMAGLHAAWWGRVSPLDTTLPWGPLALVHSPASLAAESRLALLEVQAAPGSERLLTREEVRAWLRVVADPFPLLDILGPAPQTLVQAGSALDIMSPRPAAEGQRVDIGPAAYDLAALYSSARWHMGVAPCSLSETRNIYTARLAALLEEPVDRCLLDVQFDAALALRFALLWPPAIAEHGACLLARAYHLRATVIEPALAALRRVTG